MSFLCKCDPESLDGINMNRRQWAVLFIVWSRRSLENMHNLCRHSEKHAATFSSSRGQHSITWSLLQAQIFFSSSLRNACLNWCLLPVPSRSHWMGLSPKSKKNTFGIPDRCMPQESGTSTVEYGPYTCPADIKSALSSRITPYRRIAPKPQALWALGVLYRQAEAVTSHSSVNPTVLNLHS